MSASTAAYAGWDRRREREEAVVVNIPPEILPLWDRVKGKVQGVTPHARYEAFLRYAGEHENEVLEALQLAADAKLEAWLATTARLGEDLIDESTDFPFGALESAGGQGGRGGQAGPRPQRDEAIHLALGDGASDPQADRPGCGGALRQGAPRRHHGAVAYVTDDIPRHYATSQELRTTVRDRFGSRALVSFSGGKDAVATWVALRESGFKEIVPFYLYLVPGLEFVEHGLQYYERVFGTKIVRAPHPSLIRMLRNYVFQPPERAALIDEMVEAGKLRNITYEQVEAGVRRVTGMEGVFCGIGTRAADSPIRRANITQHGALNPRRRSWFPIFDWRIKDVREAIIRSGLKLPIDYVWYGRSFDGIDARFLGPIKEYAPRDYAKILDWFPLAHLELTRRNLGKKVITP
jgi:3'-phosphoadenosine 5'-phosphosulfate sulfotransferase (PAPS reductase)/FAD synthetase